MPSLTITLKNKAPITQLILLLALVVNVNAQSNSYSPYSRFGIGEREPVTFAHNQGMAGAFIAHKPDSSMPVFINAGNPAAYALIRLTSLEIGGRYKYYDIKGANTGIKKFTANFSYGALGFPVGKNAGASFGIMPYSSVGYSTENVQASALGETRNLYSGSGGLNKAYLGYGIMPFKSRLLKFRYRKLNRPDSLQTMSSSALRAGLLVNKLLSDLSVGVNGNYMFGTLIHNSRIIFPNAQLYNNTYSERSVMVGDFTGNFGLQTAFTIDSARATNGRRRLLTEKVKIVFGFYMTLGNELRAVSNNVAYNFIYNSARQELIRDTVNFDAERSATVKLPTEQGFGIGIKKGERWNVVADFALTNWQSFNAPYSGGLFNNSFRTAIGANLVPEKYAAGRNAFWKKANYRFGAGFESGYINLNNTNVSTYYVSGGIGLPVGIGRLSSMINISAQLGSTGTTGNGLFRENFARVHVGFTFCDRWFQKFRYD